MAFENLSERLQNAIKMFRGSGKITEDDLKAPLREVRMALLEADVNFKVVKDFVANIKERALGETVQQSLTPGQQIIKIVNDELTQLLGGTQSKLTVADKPPTVIMLVGLQGAGKTTTAGKLGSLLRKKGKKPLLVAGDVYRPAAIKQLQVLGEQLSLPVFALGDQVSPVEIARKAMDKAFSLACDTVIIDTAGRLHINEELMDELRNIKAAVNPHEILLVVDAMTGQDAVTVAESFNGELGIDGLIVTKLDGDARGGAVLSVKAVTGRPVKFVGRVKSLRFGTFPSRPYGIPYPGHGRYPVSDRKDPVHDRPCQSFGNGKETAQRRIHARAVPGTNAAGQKNGLAGNYFGAYPRYERHQPKAERSQR